MSKNEDDFPSLEPIESARTAALIHRLSNTLQSIYVLVESLKEKSAQKDVTDDETQNILSQLQSLTEGSQHQLESYLRHLSLSLSDDDKIAPVNVNLAIQESLKDFRYSSNASDRELFELDLNPELPDVRARKRDLVLAINNLVSNSVNAVQQKGSDAPLIKIRSHLIQDKVGIDVIDNGIGIPSHLRKSLFSIGFSTKGSSGFGLWFTKQSVEQWGGDLELVRTDPEGTTFRILLNKWESPITLSGERRVLIVEDEDTQRMALTRSLAARGFDVRAAGTIDEAIKQIRGEAYDVALLDIRLDFDTLPSTTGLDIARLVREYNPEALIIMHSAYASLDLMKEAIKVGIDDFISKTEVYSFKDLVTRIEEALPRKLEEAAHRRETRRESIRREQQDRFIYETLSIFSHELRGPLIEAHWNVEALRSGTLGAMTKEQSNALESAHSAIKREFLLLDTHLDLSRIERGLEVLNYKPYDLVKIMREEISAHEDGARRKNVRINVILPEDTAAVKIDINRFRAALNPLMNNAIKFSSEGSEVSVSMKLEDSYVEVYISDQGPGIKPEELDRLLGREASGDIKLNQRIRASGLGLSLAKRIIEDYHDGKLWFMKKKRGEKGTTVAFRLPIQS